MPEDSDLKDRYLAGVARWSARDIESAVGILSAVVQDGDITDGWWHSASRALAQISLELDDSEAQKHLRKLQGPGVGDAQTLALRARAWYQAGDEEAAIAEIHAAAMRLVDDTATDVGSLMNGAMALIWCADVLAELGYADDASALAVRAHTRMTQADVHDAVLLAMLAVVEASIACLIGNEAFAEQSLERFDLSISPDLEIKATLIRARLARAKNRSDDATQLYADALGAARASGYGFLERSIRTESTTGPPRIRTDRAPIGQWDLRAMENALEHHRPYALVIRLPIRDENAIHEFEDGVAALLATDPGLGHVDGTGSDGDVWELFLEGEDPERLWNAIRPLLNPSDLWRYAEISQRSGTSSLRFRPGRPRA